VIEVLNDYLSYFFEGMIIYHLVVQFS